MGKRIIIIGSEKPPLSEIIIKHLLHTGKVNVKIENTVFNTILEDEPFLFTNPYKDIIENDIPKNRKERRRKK